MNKIQLNEQDKALFMQAMEEYYTKGNSLTKCNVCHAVITFKKEGEAVVHSCQCGKFNGSLRS